MNQRYVAQFTRMAASVEASKQHRDTFLIHPLVQSGMRTRREKSDETSFLTMSTARVQMFAYMAETEAQGAGAIDTCIPRWW